MPKIGAHVSAAVSLERAFDKAKEIQADCMQFFISPPQQWVHSQHDDEEIERFLQKQKETGIGPNFIHSTYLVNLGTKDTVHLQKSVDWLIYALNMANRLQVKGVIVHPGSHKGEGMNMVLEQVVNTIRTILANSPENVNLILETSSSKNSIGFQFLDFGMILKQVHDDRLKVCLDTQHSFAAGYDVRSVLGLKDVIQELEEEIGIKNLAALHVNDSKKDYKSYIDRHENIGEGFIGEEGFINMVNHPALSNAAFILEVPGFSGNGPDIENVQKLKSLVQLK